MKRIALVSAVVLAVIMICTLAAAQQAQDDLIGKWTQVGVEASYMTISGTGGKYTAVYVTGETTCTLNDVQISGNTLVMKGRYSIRKGFTTDMVLNLTLSNDRILLSGTKAEVTNWIAKDGIPMQAEDNNEVVFTK